MKVDPDQLLAAARIKTVHSPKNELHITLGGDSLGEIDYPCNAYIFIPDSPVTDRDGPSTRGLSDYSGNYHSIQITKAALHGKKGRLTLDQLPDGTDLEGAWVCIQKDLLPRTDALYFFEMAGRPVLEEKNSPEIGTVIDYLETGAHGVLVIRLKEENNEIWIPFIDEFAVFDREAKAFYIPAWRDFLT